MFLGYSFDELTQSAQVVVDVRACCRIQIATGGKGQPENMELFGCD